MACEVFISYFKNFLESNQAETEFDFSKLKEKLLFITPKKLKISPSDNIRSLALQMPDAIVSNLALNHFFIQCSDLKFGVFRNLFNLLVNTGHLAENQKMAQLIFMLHLSKSDIETREEWLNFLQSFNSISLVENRNGELICLIRDLFHILKANSLIADKIGESIREIIGNNDLGIELYNYLKNKMILYLFECKISGVRGFAGIDSIYVNFDELLSLFNKLKELSFAEDVASNILKLEFIRIYIHEVSHVVVRKCLNDFNLSTPTAESNRRNINEAGIHSEKKFFSKRINWLASVSYKYFNQQYCMDFLNTILRGELISFDFDASKCVENTSQINIMAIDYMKPNSAEFY